MRRRRAEHLDVNAARHTYTLFVPVGGVVPGCVFDEVRYRSMGMRMQVRVRLEQPDVPAMIELRDWLDRDDRLGPGSAPSWGGEPADGHMSGALGWLQFGVGTALALGQLLVAIAAWRDSRPDKPSVLVSAETEHGIETVHIDTSDPDALDRAVRALSES